MITQYRLSTFSHDVFGGNLTPVCWLINETIDHKVLLALAAQNNLSETIVVLPPSQSKAVCDVRWFNLHQEIRLCGHGSLAVAYLLFEQYPELLSLPKEVTIYSPLSGFITLYKKGSRYAARLPRYAYQQKKSPNDLLQALNIRQAEYYESLYHMFVLESDSEVLQCSPDFSKLCSLTSLGEGVCLTAPSHEADIDYVTRFFTPEMSFPEDPATGSSQCFLAPFWAEKLNKNRLVARQLSERNGLIYTTLDDDVSVIIAGDVVMFSTEQIQLS